MNFSEMAEIAALISTKMGLYFPEERWSDLIQGLTRAGHSLGFKDTYSYVRWLSAQNLSLEQIEVLANYLTVGETYFLREPKYFEFLEQEILPPFLMQKTPLRLWSAGCCTGEEAYSLAITCLRAIPHQNFSILATDLNPKFLHKARMGLYSEWSFRGTPTWFKENFFTKTSDRKFLISPDIKSLVHFERMNLVQDLDPTPTHYLNSLDIIFCRNVLMYFTHEQQKKIAIAFHDCLVENGILMVSPAEASVDLFSMFMPEQRGEVLFFRKTKNQKPLKRFLELNAFFQPPIANFSFSTTEKQINTLTNTDESCLSLARYYANQGQLEQAQYWCAQAISFGRTNLSTYFLSATIYQESGRLSEAIMEFLKVLYLDPDFILAHYILGSIYHVLEKREESKKHISIALELLAKRDKEEILPESGGVTCGQLAESIKNTRNHGFY
ncbi:chemotaxis protein methyltransferase CheR [Gammaproteobacteria bacterium]